MRAIILAAGVGKRLGAFTQEHPKCLLEFDGKSLLARHLEQLNRLRLEHISIVVGYLEEQIAAEVQACSSGVAVTLIRNDRFDQGSALSLQAAAADLREGPVLIMDADLLYAPELLDRLLSSPHENCLLVDSALVDTGEEVKAVVRDGLVRELGKQVIGQGEIAGESVGIFKFGSAAGARLADLLAAATHLEPRVEYEPVVDELIKEVDMGFARVDGLPWIEIDFAEDVQRARELVAPGLA